MKLRALVPSALIVATLLVEFARADILFFDLNDSQKERQAAERAAARRGEKLINVPLVEPQVRDDVRALEKDVQKADYITRRSCAESAGSGRCATATQNLKSAESSYNSYVSQIKRFGKDELTQALAKVKKDGNDISSIIISGHDGDRQYWGTYAWFEDDNLMDALEANQPLGQNLRSLYLWGCYTGITDDFLKHWDRAIPSSTMIAGFDGQSPLGTNESSGALLEDLMVKEAQLTQERDRKELGRIFSSLAYVNYTKPAVCLNHETIVSHKGVRAIEDDNKYCDLNNSEEAKWQDLFNCYYNAQVGCTEIPEEIDESSPLRQAYSYSQETKHCYTFQQTQGRRRLLIPVHVRRLLFDNIVRANFERLHKDDLDKLNRLLAALGFPPELRLLEIGKMSRGQYLSRKRAIKDYWNAQKQAMSDQEGRVYDPRILAVGSYLSAIDLIEDGTCVPGTWHEKRGRLDESQCMVNDRRTLGDAMKYAMPDAEREIANYGK